MTIPSCYRPRVCHANFTRKHLQEVNGADLLRWQMVDTDFYSYFCIYLFCLSRGMSEPLLPKAITAWARAYLYVTLSFLQIKHRLQDNLITNVAQVNCIVPFSI